jgi:hypothetical protein
MQENLDLGVTSVGITLGTTGTDVSVTGSPITTSGNITINIPTASATNRGLLSSADWTTFNNKQPAGNYVTLDTAQTITAQKTFTTSGSSDTMIISHGSGSGFALDVIKAGNGEAIRVTKTSGSGNAMTVIGGDFEAPTIVKTGGTSSEFLKADGSVDSNSYVTLDTTQTITGTKTFTAGRTNFTNNDFFQAELTNTPSSTKLNLGAGTNIGYIASSGELRFNTNYPTDALASPKLVIATNGQATFSVDAVINGVKIGRGSGNGANLRVGEETLNSNTTGILNTAIGTNALRNNTTGQSNTSTGYTALQLNTTGGQNTANGYAALQNNTTGSQNTAVGVVSLRDNTTGNQNTAVGILTLSENTTGNSNSAVGYGALTKNSTGFANAATGLESLSQNTTGYQNTATGVQSLNDNTTGNNNTAIGNRSAYKNTDGDENTAVGLNSLYSNTTGNQNTAVGFNSGALTNAGGSNETSSNSVYIGQDARSSASGNTNEIVIGSAGRGNGSNTVTLGNDSITNTYLKGAVTLTGALNGTSASFTGAVTSVGGFINGSDFRYNPLGNTNGNPVLVLKNPSSGVLSIASEIIGDANVNSNSLAFSVSNPDQGRFNALTLASTGAATFSSSVTAASALFNSTSTQLILQNTDGGGNAEKVGMFMNGTDVFKLVSLNDNNTTRVDNVLTANVISGNVGIGTASPSFALDVRGTTFSTLRLSTSGVAGSGGVARLVFEAREPTLGTGQTALIESALGNLAFKTGGISGDIAGGTERMRITSGGNVLIGQTTANGNTNGIFLRSGIQSGFTSTNVAALELQRLGSVGNVVEFYNQTTGPVGSISVTTLLTSYNTTSDYRLKEDLQEINGLEKVKAIKVYDYKWKSHDSRMDGVLAHELAEVLPYAVNGEKDAVDEEGNDMMQGVDYSKIVPILIKAIQEQQEQIDSLKNQMK